MPETHITKTDNESHLKTIGNLKVQDVMTKKVVTVGRKTTVGELKRLFDKHDYNAFPVVEGGNLVGIVTKLDFMKIFSMGMEFRFSNYLELFSDDVEDIMRGAIVTISPEATISKALDYMVEFKLRSLPVTKGRELVGIITVSDIMKHIQIE
ncbi:MAG: CBS domain-containing protein [Thermoplasmata archaeon]